MFWPCWSGLRAGCAAGGSGGEPGSATQSTDDSAATDGDAIVVTGIRRSLRTSQEIKRDSDVVVDSVTADDIGALPDRSVTEALQRIPGVAIDRFAAGRDPDHFSTEGSGVVVRGLTYVRSELNGRDTFTANNGRALSYADIPSELLGGIDVFKTRLPTWSKAAFPVRSTSARAYLSTMPRDMWLPVRSK